jgi:hypothetical protein
MGRNGTTPVEDPAELRTQIVALAVAFADPGAKAETPGLDTWTREIDGLIRQLAAVARKPAYSPPPRPATPFDQKIEAAEAALQVALAALDECPRGSVDRPPLEEAWSAASGKVHALRHAASRWIALREYEQTRTR